MKSVCVLQQSSSSTRVGGASSQLHHETLWPAAIPVLTPLHSQNSRSGPSTSTARGSSAPLSHGSAHASTTLLIPKAEKLSPVQLYSRDRSSLTGRPSSLQNTQANHFSLFINAPRNHAITPLKKNV